MLVKDDFLCLSIVLDNKVKLLLTGEIYCKIWRFYIMHEQLKVALGEFWHVGPVLGG